MFQGRGPTGKVVNKLCFESDHFEIIVLAIECSDIAITTEILLEVLST